MTNREFHAYVRDTGFDARIKAALEESSIRAEAEADHDVRGVQG